MDTLQLQSFRFTHAGVSLVVEAAPDLDALITERTDPDRLPYWAALWPSAPVLARWLIGRGGLRDVRVLELGCGVGLAGLAAAALGARVTQTDRFPEAAALARKNARRNGLAGVRHAAGDWRAWPLRARWPVVLGSDLAYERGSHAALLAVLDRALTPGGTFYLADPGRPMSRDFFARAEAAGWRASPLRTGEEAAVYALERDVDRAP